MESVETGCEECVIFDDRPHPVFVVTETWRWLFFGVLSWGVLVWVDGQVPGYGVDRLGWGVLGLVVVRVVWAMIDRWVRVQRMTDRIVMAKFGVLSTIRGEISTERVQHVVVVRTLIERVFGVGSIGISSAGTGGVEVVWRGVERPDEVVARIRSAVDRVRDGRDGKMGMGQESKKMVVIGLVGGIGSGKSTVARAFAELGCVVSDSDREGAKALEDPKVVRELVSWWGRDILDGSGSVDRKKVAGIVFMDREARKKLEDLVHPMIHEARRSLIRKSREDGGIRGVIVDAPLLFEAGVDSECDAVVFVQTPKRIRVRRVVEHRGWDEAELDRRENAQMGLEQKRERADYVVANGGSLEELSASVSRVLEEIERSMDGDR